MKRTTEFKNVLKCLTELGSYPFHPVRSHKLISTRRTAYGRVRRNAFYNSGIWDTCEPTNHAMQKQPYIRRTCTSYSFPVAVQKYEVC